MRYFCLESNGDVRDLGDCADWSEADFIAEQIGLEIIWIVGGNEALQWAECITKGFREEALGRES